VIRDSTDMVLPGALYLGVKLQGVKLTTDIHLVSRPRKHGAILPLHQYDFMAWCSVQKSTGTTLSLTGFYYKGSILKKSS
jgi:hypothetical protein